MQKQIPQRNGLTLLEMVLVLSLLVVVFSVVVPRMVNSVGSRRLVNAADEVRTAWAKGRNRAMRNGEEFQFLYFPATRAYALTPMPVTDESELVYELTISGLSAVASAVDEQQFSQTAERMINQGVHIERLPVAITFADAATAARLSPLPMAAEDANSASTGVSAVTFHPDGSTSNALVWLASEDGEAIPISLRGITGISTIGEPVIGVTGGAFSQ